MLGLISLAISAVAAFAYPTLEPRQNSTTSTLITGAFFGSLGQRQEVHTLQSDVDAWNIYLLALARMQSQDAANPMSYYSIASIHGQPFSSWDNVGPCTNCTLGGYCTHVSTLFPTWHRVYLGLFEQSLVWHAMSAASEFEGAAQDLYFHKAQSLRMPYWDWARLPQQGEDPFPQMFSVERVAVTTPQGYGTIPNPLRQYTFNLGEDSSFMSLDGSAVPYTIRNLTFTASARQQLRTDLWTMLSSQQSYNAFSTQALMPGDDNFNPSSIEAVHDQVHILIGGHMKATTQSAFDPIFWLHHANVDHIFAIWQTANPDAWMEQWSEVGSTMTYSTGTLEDSQSPLTPFHSSANGNFWNSNTARGTEILNYQYDDLATGSSAASIINALYRDAETTVRRSKRAIGFSGSKVSDYINQIFGQLASGKIQEYVANIQVDSMSMNGSFTVFLFDGGFDEEDPSCWYNESTLIGSHGFFSSPHPMGDGSAKVNAGITITDSLLLNVAGGVIDSLANGAVTKYLKDRIEWRILTANGTVMDDTDVPGLVITIVTAEVQLSASDDQLPSWGAFEALEDITRDRACGYGDASAASKH